MNVSAVVDRFDSPLRVVVRVMQLLLVGIVGFALFTVDLGLLVNSGLPLAVSALPILVHRRHGHELNAGLELWITTAAFIHAVGALGPYETFGWYDQVAHTVSAALVAGVGYAFVQAIDRHHERIRIPPRLRSVFLLVFVLAFGVLWEILEFASGGAASLVGGEAVLAQFGLSDIVFDLLFNCVGALLVAVWGTGYFDGLAGLFGRRMDDSGSGN